MNPYLQEVLDAHVLIERWLSHGEGSAGVYTRKESEGIHVKRIKIGILTMSDGREYLHEEYEEMNLRYQRDIAAALEATGGYTVHTYPRKEAEQA